MTGGLGMQHIWFDLGTHELDLENVQEMILMVRRERKHLIMVIVPERIDGGTIFQFSEPSGNPSFARH